MRKLLTVVMLIVLFLVACGVQSTTTATDNSEVIELIPINTKFKAHAHELTMYMNPDTECIYIRTVGDRSLTPIKEQDYTYSITGGKCRGPYQTKYKDNN